MSKETERLEELAAAKVRRDGSRRVTKVEWYDKGGFANSRLWRRQAKSGRWIYYEVIE